MAILKGSALLAYTAGIIDGEGTIGLHRNTQNKNASYAILVGVGNTNLWLLELLHMQFGGGIYSHSEETLKHKESWAWQIRAKKAGEFLKLILPYLQIKRPQAELALQFQERRQGSIHLNSKAKVLDEADRILMASYNQRGPNKIKQEVSDGDFR